MCVDCDDVAFGQYLDLDLGQGAAIEFAVCAAHVTRIEGGECPASVPRQVLTVSILRTPGTWRSRVAVN